MAAGDEADDESEHVVPDAEPKRVRVLDPASRAWLERLTSSGPDRDDAIRELHALLLRAARFTLAKRGSTDRQLGRDSDELAMEAADEALVAILARLEDYRGDSRFTTWASKFVILQTSVTLRRRAWVGRELPLEEDAWAAVGLARSPHARLEQQELLDALKRGVERELTPHQRMVFVALALNGVPVDVLAERTGTSRGALYKTLHDARRRLRAHLAASGIAPS